MKSCHSRKSKRRVEDSYSFDSSQIGWNKNSSFEKCNAQKLSSHTKISNKSFDWERSCEGFSEFVFDPKNRSSRKSQNVKKQKVTFESVIVPNSSYEEHENLDEEVISWHSSESDHEDTNPDQNIIRKSNLTKKKRISKRLQVEDIDNLSDSDSEVNKNHMGHKKKNQNEDLISRLSPLISSCSSSSQSPCVSGLKGSDWMKMMDWEKSPEKQDTFEEQPDPDSAKKKHKKYIRGGLAESLFRIQSREKSSLRIWKHQKQTNTFEAPTKSLKVKVQSYESIYSLQMATCQVLGTDGREKKSQAVIFNKHIIDDLQIGTEVEIFAPWQELNCVLRKVSVILCTNFVRVLSQPAVKSDIKTSLLPKVTYSSLWSCPCSKDTSLHSKDCPVFVSLTKLHEDRVIPVMETAVVSSVSEVSTTDTIITNFHTVTSTPVPDLTNQETPTLRQCLENHSDQSLSFMALITRVFYWYDTRLQKSRCSLLIEDSGIIAVIHLQDDRDLGNLDKSRLCMSWFTGLKVQQRITRDKDAKLFSVIDKAWTGLSCQSYSESQNSQSQTLFTESQQPPCFCYILIPHPDDVFDLNTSDNTTTSTVLNIKQPELKHIEQSEVMTRFSCTCKLLYSTPYTEPTRQFYITDQSLLSIEVPYKVVTIFPSNHLYPLETNPPGPVIFCTDLRLLNGVLVADEYSRVTIVTDNCVNIRNIEIKLPSLSTSSTYNSLITVQGQILNINEETACSWEECDICGSDELIIVPQDSSTLCKKCNQTVVSPVIKLEMEVYLTIDTMLSSIVRCNLLQSTIQSLLPTEQTDEGYDINQVIGQTLPAINCVVKQSVTSTDSKPVFLLQQIED